MAIASTTICINYNDQLLRASNLASEIFHYIPAVNCLGWAATTIVPLPTQITDEGKPAGWPQNDPS